MNNFPLLSIIDDHIKKHNLLPDNSTIIIGLSGGPDSVFLTHLLHYYAQQKNVRLIAAHLDHEWRAESKHDADFCAQLAQTLNIPFVIKRISQLDIPIKDRGSKEDSGRQYRQFFFNSLKQTYDANYIALGHHKDDQNETFFIRLLRGTTLSGLIGMKPKNKDYIRPLLVISKDSMIQYLQKNNISFCTDQTNNSTNFLRNAVRAHIMPACRATDSRFEHNMTRLLENLHQTENFLTTLTETTYQNISIFKENHRWINLDLFNTVDSFLQDRVVIYWLIDHKVPFTLTKSFIDEIKKFIHYGSQHHTLNKKWSLSKNKNHIFIAYRD